MQRLYDAAEKLKRVTGQSAVAALLNESPQTLNNWELRGISQRGAIVAQKKIGCSATWIKNGDGEMHQQTGDTSTPGDTTKPTGKLSIVPAAVTLDLDAECLVVWSQLQKLPERDRQIWMARLARAAADVTLLELGVEDNHENPPAPKDRHSA